MDLTQAKQLQDLPALWVHVIDTPDSHDKCQLAFWLHIVAIVGLCLPFEPNEVSLLQCNDNEKSDYGYK